VGTRDIARLLFFLTISWTGFAFGISDSLMSVDFESSVAKKVAQNVSRYRTVRDLLQGVHTGNRNDAFFIDNLISQYGHQALPQIVVVGSKMEMQDRAFRIDHTEFELVSSLERVYMVNEMSVRISDQDSFQIQVESLERIFKAHKRRQWTHHLIEFFCGAIAWADDAAQFLEKNPRFQSEALVWAAVTVAIERKVATQARVNLSEQAPAVGGLLEKIQADVGLQPELEVSCQPFAVAVNGEDKGSLYDPLVAKCCRQNHTSCEHVINSISTSSHSVAHSPQVLQSSQNPAQGPGPDSGFGFGAGAQ